MKYEGTVLTRKCYFFVSQVIKMLTIVVVLFAVCWLPLQTYNFSAEIFVEINM